MGYLLEFWVLDPPDDSKTMTAPRLLWESWVIFEVMTTASTLPNCMIFLLFRAAGIELFDYRQITEDTDIIEQQLSIIHGFSAYVCAGLQYIAIALWLRSMNVDAELVTLMSLASFLYFWGWISMAFMMSARNIFHKRGSINAKFLKVIISMQISMLIACTGIATIGVLIIVKDEGQILTPFAVFNILAGVGLIVANIYGLRRDTKGVTLTNALTDKQKADQVDKQNAENAEEWRKTLRLGQSLNVREDLYAWAFIRSFNRDHLALLAFQSRKQAEVEKNTEALELAKE